MGTFKSLKTILPKILIDNNLDDSVLLESIKNDWLLKLDTVFSKIAKPVKISSNGKTLYLKATSISWVEEMMSEENSILLKINNAFPEIQIEHIKFIN